MSLFLGVLIGKEARVADGFWLSARESTDG